MFFSENPFFKEFGSVVVRIDLFDKVFETFKILFVKLLVKVVPVSTHCKTFGERVKDRLVNTSGTSPDQLFDFFSEHFHLLVSSFDDLEVLG